ncbi:type II toxin-antitoxin system VapC family toxin [Novosphingobium colocasiae]|uniref:type II toxin-antitoxin system VapC family toxin n=1 Tax=Novosphingobium colocasiae TaxID=1256513 RepID=UPI0035AEF5E1
MIVDASVAVKWVLREADSPAAIDLLARSDLCAPDFILIEVANVLWKAWRAGALDEQSVTQALEQMPCLFATLRPAEKLVATALRIATELDHPVYDCLYVAAALADGDRLITADRRFVGKLEQSPYHSLATLLI